MALSEEATLAEEIELRSSDNTIRFYWADKHTTVYKSKDLRVMCNCAVCVDERTGIRILDPDTVPESIQVANIAEVGNYGIRIDWSSGHNTGIFTWDRLRKVDPSAPENLEKGSDDETPAKDESASEAQA